jgi:Uma2 family endonuclease
MSSLALEDAIDALTAGPYESEDESMVLYDVPWSLYCWLRDLRSNRAKRMLYLEGELHIVSPTRRHERYSRVVGLFINYWAIHHQVPLMGAGSTTYRRKDLKTGLEPDQCFYIERLKQVRPDSEVDLSVEPMPDLVIEVDVTRVSRRKLEKYAEFGVPEVWVWRKEIRVLVLEGETYQEQAESRVLPGFPITEVTRLLNRPSMLDETTLAREFLALIQEGKQP